MLELRRLEVLAAAAREGSLAAGARKLGLTAGAASQAVAALEASTGVVLLTRLPRGVRPTPAGERLVAHAEAVLATLHRAEAELAGQNGQSIRIAAPPTAVYGLIPGVLTRLRATAPELEVTVLELEPGPARAALRAGDCEVALVNHSALLAPDLHGPWHTVHIRDEPVYAALPPGHPLAARADVAVGELADDPWLTQPPMSPCQELIQHACAAAGFAPDITATCGDYRSILALVGAGTGVSLIPELALTGLATPPVALLPTRPRISRRINALVTARTQTTAPARAVLDALLEYEQHR
ncbi:LysR family transcriptional regulator [Actinomadura darangshiensis]|uniref:LysR family transcriptional regulator n=1 Tax=Actinomadura darangshiensis TaxID=705336 RepID=A0A4R5BQU4_9ACTN|nr:LysR substrate-binding domain-containing protein [Actinomadura darangshiensis]TDD89328.1 LysR family transcriptional regulator [Actinomadura darangshiensis]